MVVKMKILNNHGVGIVTFLAYAICFSLFENLATALELFGYTSDSIGRKAFAKNGYTLNKQLLTNNCTINNAPSNLRQEIQQQTQHQ